MSEKFETTQRKKKSEDRRLKKINPIVMTFVKDENLSGYGEVKAGKDWRNNNTSDKKPELEFIFHPVDRIF